MVEVSGGQDRWGREVQNISNFFYADDGLVALTDPVCLQGTFNTPDGLLDIVGLQKNVGNMVGMICHLFWSVGTHLDAAYKRRMTGEGLT